MFPRLMSTVAKLPRNFRVVLNSRPGSNSEPLSENFRHEECPYPAKQLDEGEAVIRSLYLSTDPAQRCQMNDDTGVDYISAWSLNESVIGLEGVGIIEKSNFPVYKEGDLVHGVMVWPWQTYFVQNLDALESQYVKLDKNIFEKKPSLPISLLGIAGMTAIIGVQQNGHIKPGRNQTLVLSGAAGACGSLAGQIGRLEGCSRVVGICGSQEKCDWLVGELGFDAAINYKTQNIEQGLRETCPQGIDVYFDNVGGEISDTVITQMNPESHVILCGQIAVYNSDVEYPPPLRPPIQEYIHKHNITRDRFLVVNHTQIFEPAIKQLLEWYFSGKIKVRETVAEGLENAGNAFVSMMKGGNIGKQIVRVSDP